MRWLWVAESGPLISSECSPLTSVRPYKRAWTVEDAVELIRSESGRHFDPRVVTAFLNCLPEILEIKARWQDDAEEERLLA